MKNNKVYKEFKIKNVQGYNYSKGYYKNKNRNNKKTRFNLDTALSNKLNREFKEFCKNIMKKDKQAILNSAYEITVKEELKEELKNMNLYSAEKEMLFLQDDILNEFYHDWLDCDTPLGESMQPCLQESIATLTKYIGKKIKNNNEQER